MCLDYIISLLQHELHHFPMLTSRPGARGIFFSFCFVFFGFFFVFPDVSFCFCFFNRGFLVAFSGFWQLFGFF